MYCGPAHEVSEIVEKKLFFVNSDSMICEYFRLSRLAIFPYRQTQADGSVNQQAIKFMQNIMKT